jgi:NTP pyrophosphatase (non-canonical NTP hydrolase)
MQLKPIIKAIKSELSKAITKHPNFDYGHGKHYALTVLMEEVGEVAAELQNNNYKSAFREMAQVAAVSIRFMNYLLKNHGDKIK